MAKHVVIAGAGLGGLRAAEQLRAAGHAGPVTVIGAEPHPPYNRPPLSKELLASDILAAGSGPDSVPAITGNPQRAAGSEVPALHERVAFRRRASVADVEFRLGTAIEAADLDARKLALADGTTVSFDGLIAATGLRPRRLGVPGPAGPDSGRHVIRTLDDCAALRADLRALLGNPPASAAPLTAAAFHPKAAAPAPAATTPSATTGRPRVVVVGGGFIGCEVACTTHALGCDVTVIEPAGPPMLRVLGEELATAIQAHHERALIRFLTGTTVLGYTGGSRVTGVVVSDEPGGGIVPGGPISGGPAVAGAVLPADIVIEAVGSVPNTEWLAATGLDISDGVLVGNDLAVGGQSFSGRAATAGPATTGSTVPGALVVAVGDVARFPNPLFDDVPRRVEHWSMPTDTARRAAATLVSRLSGGAETREPFKPIPSFWSDQGSLRLQSFGSPAIADDARITEGDPGNLEAGVLAEYYRDGRNVGSVAVNLPPSRQRELRAALAAVADSA